MWTGADIAFLRRNAELGAGAIALHLGRSVGSVKQEAQRLRISLRRPGERRGSVLGQPRGVSVCRGELSQEMLEWMRASGVDPIAGRRELEESVGLCPRCAARPARVLSSGLCTVCHLHDLAAAHREELAEELAVQEAQRDLWAARQELCRARSGSPCE